MALKENPAEQHGAPLFQDWVALVFRPLVISGMMACIAAGWVAVAQFFSPAWQGTYLVIVVALAMLEMLASDQLSRRLLPASQRLRVHVAEMLLAALALRPLMYLQRGRVELLMDARVWLYQPLAFFKDVEYAVGLIVLVGLWLVGLDIAQVLYNLEDPYTQTSEREAHLTYLNGRFVMGALFLLAAATVVQVELSPQGILLRPVELSSLTWLPLVYVGLGMLLFGQARLALLQAKWQRDGVPVAAQVSRRWAAWGVLFVAGVSLLALLLPAGSTELGFYLFLWLNFLLAALGGLLLFALQLLLYLILAPLMALLQAGRQPIVPGLKLPAPPTLPSGVAERAPQWWTYLRLTLFWIGACIVVLWLGRELLRHWQSIGPWGSIEGGFFAWLAKLWRALLGRWRGLQAQVQRLARRPGRAVEGETAAATLGWWGRWRARTARERVRRLYLLLLERARLAGYGRSPSQTPYEYQKRLSPNVTGDEEALEGITQAFVQARYTRRDFGAEEVKLLHRLWNRLRSRLRRRSEQS